MAAQRKTAALFALCCCYLLVSCEGMQAGASCPGGWRMFGDNCYRLTASRLRQDQLTATCRQLGGAAVSIHSAQENSFIGNLAGGKYVWLGMRLTGRNQHTWEDGTSYSYSKFLPARNRMLKRAIVGSGVLQQSCLRWNYDTVSRLLHGVCKMAAVRCPADSAEITGRCYSASEQRVPWWEGSSACHHRDPRSQPVTLSLQDWQLTHALTTHFGAETKLIAGVESVGDSCNWTSIQYGQTTSHRCDFGCPELLPVICSRPSGLVTSDQPREPVRLMPLMYSREQTAAPADPSCPTGWMPRGKRCVSTPTPAATRLQALALCQERHSSRLATLRHDSSRPIIALQLKDVPEAWVRDERPVASLRFGRKKLQPMGRIQLEHPEYSVLTADGQVLTRSADEQLPAVCEHCQVPCEHGGLAFSGRCYKVLEGPRTLSNASRSCAQLGGTLVSVESLPENRFLTALAFPSSPQCGQPGNELWLGLQRINAAFSWEWEDCSTTSAEAWAPGEGFSGHCVTLSHDGLWRNPTDCRQQLRVACEWDPCEEGQYGGTCLQLGHPGAVY